MCVLGRVSDIGYRVKDFLWAIGRKQASYRTLCYRTAFRLLDIGNWGVESGIKKIEGQKVPLDLNISRIFFVLLVRPERCRFH